MSQAADFRTEARISAWLIFSMAVLALQGALNIVHQRNLRLALSNILLFVLLIAAAKLYVQNAVASRHAIRLFWSFLAIAAALWAIDPLLGIFHAMGKISPGPIFSASALFLHGVAALAAMASYAHIKQAEHRQNNNTLNFLLLLLFWMLVYFFLLPSQHLHWDGNTIRWFSWLYFAESTILIAAMATFAVRARGPWKMVYRSLLAGAALQTAGSLILDLGEAGSAYSAGMSGLFSTGAACFLIQAAMPGRASAPRLVEFTLPAHKKPGPYPGLPAMLVVAAIPLLPAIKLLWLSGLGKVYAMRLSAVLIGGLLLMLTAFIREYFVQHELALDTGLIWDQIHLAIQAGKAIGWDLNLSTVEGTWFGDLETYFGIAATTYVAPLQDFYHLIHPADRRKVLRAMRSAAQSRKPYTAVFRVVLPDHTLMWVSSHGQFYYQEGVDPTHMLGIAVDISEQKQAEAALQESASKFRNIIDTAPVLIWTCGTDKLCDYFNQSWLDFTGRPFEAELRNGWTERIHPEDVETCYKVFTKSFDARQPFHMEYRLKRHDGEYRWVLDTGTPRFTEDGAFKGYIGSAIDVSEMKQAEKKAAIENEHLQLALEASGAGVWDVDVQSGQSIQFGNQQVLFGSASVGNPLEEFMERVHPDEQARFRQTLESARREKTRFREEFRVLCPDGTLRWLGLEGKFLYSPGGQPERMLGMTIDVTERKHAEEALQNSEQEFSLAFEAARIGWWVWNEETGHVITSEGTKAVLGLPSDLEISLQTFFHSVHPEDRDQVYRTWQQSLEAGTLYFVEYKVLRSDGTTFWVESRGHTYSRPPGRFVQMIGVCMDITERKRSEETLRSLGGRLIEAQEQERMRIARELHDDICQRLAILEIELERIKYDPESPRPKLQQNMDHLTEFTREIVSDLQSLSHELHSSKLEILGLVAAMKSFCAEFARQHNVEIDFTSSDVPLPLSREVSIGLYRVLQEAVHNAFKHSGVRYFAVQLREERGVVELTIRDFGIGFDPETATHGRGLGLISMRERINLLNGTMSIESLPMWGTTIRARIPIGDQRALRCA